jgi:L-2-hydroxyglutarate oxidase
VDVNVAELLDALTFPGFWKFILAHPGMCARELGLSFSKKRFCRALQKLVPELQPEDLEAGHSGVRAQAMSPAGQLLQDFSICERSRALHLLNAPSPAATAALAIGQEVAARAGRLFQLKS